MTGREKRHQRIRTKIRGTKKRPRLSVYRSLKYVYAQLIDDTKGHTIASATSFGLNKGSKIEQAEECGKILGKRAKKKHIEYVVFDRGGYKYHGRVKALAQGARKAKLKF